MARSTTGTLFALATLLASSWALAQAAPPSPPAAKPVPEKPAAEKPPAAKPAPEPPARAGESPEVKEALEAPAEAAPPATAPPVGPAAPAPAPMGPTPYPWGPPGTAVPPGSPSVAPAPAEEPAEEPLPPAGPPDWQASLGLRTAFHSSSSFDPFSENNVFPQGSLGLSRRLLTREPFSLALALGFDGGMRESTARGAPTKLEAYRILAGPEARWHWLPELYFFARPSVGVLRTVASLEEGTSGTTLSAKSWLLAIDASAGAAFAFADLRRHAGDLRFWIVVDGGYGWSGSSDLALAPEDDASAPQRTANVDLGSLALRGPFFRGAVAASF